MSKEAKQRIRRRRLAIVPVAILMLSQLSQSFETKWPVVRALFGGRADCPPAQPTDSYAVVMTDAGHEMVGRQLNPNFETYRTFNAAAIKIYEDDQEGNRPNLVVMLNGNTPFEQNINSVYRNRFNRFLNFYSHGDESLQFSPNEFQFSNQPNTDLGAQDLATILQENHIDSVKLYSSPQANRAAILMCERGIPTEIIDTERILQTHTSRLVPEKTPLQKFRGLQSWVSENAKLTWMLLTR